MSESPLTIIVAVVVNLAIALAKYVASMFTGSAAMLAEAIHSTVDTGNEALLLLGQHRSAKPADARHPFGYGQEIYFWSLVVAMVIFGVGGGAAIMEGVRRFSESHGLEHIAWSYAVLGIALIFEFVSWAVAYRAVRNEYPQLSIAAAVRRSKDPGRFVVFLEDTAAILGLLIALIVGTFFAVRFPNAHLDAIASILIGVLLIGTAVFLMSKSRSLLIGQSADKELLDGIRDLLAADERIERVGRILTAQLAPDNVLLNLELRLRPGTVDGELPQTIDRIENAIRERFPELKEIFIEAQAFKGTA
ncbi:MAG TPA: cation diffusion facilitator family transporter [Candidatus Baltobacteraceae bacterium]|nr:cation diffusion facilitator family transporter [Candidatus Baltobacteraceae bacterium]